MVLRASRASANKINSGICAKHLQKALAANFIAALKFHRRGKILPHLQNLREGDFAKLGFEILSEACTARTLADNFRPFGFYFHFKIYGTKRCAI